MSRSHLIRLLLATSVGLSALTGCSAQPADAPQPDPAPSAAGPTQEPAMDTITGADALTTYAGLARESCAYAQSAGVVETITGKGPVITVVMIPKDDAYQDFSAAYLTAPDDYQPIFETDALAVCADAMTFILAEEAGQPLTETSGIAVSLTVDGRTSDAVFTVDYTLYGEATTTRYTAQDNLMVTAEDLDKAGKVTSTRQIRYGTTAKDRAIIVTATDRFLAKN